MCVERPKDWDRYLNFLLFAYRETLQESTGFTPFEVLYGRNVRGLLTILKELWTKDKYDPDVQNSYQYVIDLKDKLSTTCEVVQQQWKRVLNVISITIIQRNDLEIYSKEKSVNITLHRFQQIAHAMAGPILCCWKIQ